MLQESKDDGSKNSLIYLFGGLNIVNSTLNDMWCYDTMENEWSQVEQLG